MKKNIFYTELAYILGLIVLAFGAAFMAHADFGVSMVVAPAYILHLKLSQSLPFFTFGFAEYTLQLVLVLLLILVMRRFKLFYLFSVVTAVLYGLLLDLAMISVSLLNIHALPGRLAGFVGGMLLCSLGVSMLFHTYIAPEAYELVVKELSGKYGIEIHKLKTAYDCLSLTAGIVLSFCFFGFGHFEGVKWGTILCALINGWIIGRFSHILETHFDFRDRFKLRHWFS